MILTYALNLLVIVGLVWLVWNRAGSQFRTEIFCSALIFKLICGVLLGVLFVHHYGVGDTLNYFSDARENAMRPFNEFWQYLSSTPLPNQPVRAILFTKITAVLIWASNADYWLCSLYFSLTSFLGAWYLVNQFTKWDQRLKIPAIVAFLFLPSVVFWSSGLLKESLVFGAVCFLVGGYLKFRNRFQVSTLELFVAVMSLVIVISLKYYIAAILIPALSFLIISQRLPQSIFGIQSKSAQLVFLTGVMFVIGFMFTQWLSPNFRLDRFFEVIQSNRLRMLSSSDSEVSIPAIAIFENDLDHILNMFYYSFSGLFRPLFPDQLAFPNILASIENFLILSVGFFALFNLTKIGNEYKIELIVLLFYISTLSILIAYSLPNFGTIARMKVYYFPFLVFLILIPLSSRFKITLRSKK